MVNGAMVPGHTMFQARCIEQGDGDAPRDHFTRQLEMYLEEHDGTTPLPKRVCDSIHAALPRTWQAPAQLADASRLSPGRPEPGA